MRSFTITTYKPYCRSTFRIGPPASDIRVRPHPALSAIDFISVGSFDRSVEVRTRYQRHSGCLRILLTEERVNRTFRPERGETNSDRRRVDMTCPGLRRTMSHRIFKL